MTAPTPEQARAHAERVLTAAGDPARSAFGQSIGDVLVAWHTLADWQRRAVSAIAPELTTRLAAANSAITVLFDIENATHE